MNKKLMAVAVAGALAAPAAMAQSNVTISGRMSVGVDTYSATGASQTGSAGLVSRNRVWDNGSRLTVAGNEDLGNGLKAMFYVETGFNADNGLGTGNNNNGTGQSTSTTLLPSSSNVGALGSRIAYVGVEGGFGKLTFGRQNVFWTNGIADQTQSNYVQAGTPFQTGSFGSGMGVGITRQPNTVQYATPRVGGFEAIVSWSPNNQEGVQLTTSGATTQSATVGGNTVADAKGRLWGLTAQWTGGPFQVGYDWVESRANGAYMGSTTPSSTFGTNLISTVQTGQVTGHKARAAWSYQPGAVLGLIWTRSEVKNGGVTAGGGTQSTAMIKAADGTGTDIGSQTTLKQSAWTLNWEHMVGNTRLLAQYSQAGEIRGCNASETVSSTVATLTGRAEGSSGCSGTSAKAYMLGAQYLLSKRTSVAITYNKITNGSMYFSDYTSGNNSSLRTVAGGGAMALGASSTATNSLNGADPTMWGIGIMHNF